MIVVSSSLKLSTTNAAVVELSNCSLSQSAACRALSHHPLTVTLLQPFQHPHLTHSIRISSVVYPHCPHCFGPCFRSCSGSTSEARLFLTYCALACS